MTTAEEDYLKSILKLSEAGEAVNTNDIAADLKMKPASVTDMLRKLAAKKLIQYKKYYGVKLSANGLKRATAIVRRHRLWEFFLSEKLGVSWDAVHPMAEELEHVSSDELIDKLDKFLGHPRFDPHGDPIPDRNGKISKTRGQVLLNADSGRWISLSGVMEQSPAFLRHLNKLNLKIGSAIKVLSRTSYDNSIELAVEKHPTVFISAHVAQNILVTK